MPITALVTVTTAVSATVFHSRTAVKWRKEVPARLSRLHQQEDQRQQEGDADEDARQDQDGCHRPPGSAPGPGPGRSRPRVQFQDRRARRHSSWAWWSKAMADEPSPSWAIVRATGFRSANGLSGCAVSIPEPRGYS